LAPAHVTDLTVAEALLLAHTDRVVLGDKGYISDRLATGLVRTNRLMLLTIPRHNQKRQLPTVVARRVNARRQIIETVNGQLTEHLGIATHHAHSFWGLCARLYTKLTAHTLSIYLNRLCGKANFLQIKQMAFPI
jgi:hypothetical protein